jgi:hypothetical protein
MSIIITNRFESLYDFMIFMEKEEKDDILHSQSIEQTNNDIADLKEQEAIQQAKELIKMKII